MKRGTFILFTLLAVAGGWFAAGYYGAQHFRAATSTPTVDELAWMQVEFALTSQQMDNVRKVHNEYRPRCREMCNRVAARQSELVLLLQSSGEITPAVQAKLREASDLRADCESAMLQHFYHVSQAMPAPQGKRYLEEMHRLTLVPHVGSPALMVGPDSHAHGHPH